MPVVTQSPNTSPTIGSPNPSMRRPMANAVAKAIPNSGPFQRPVNPDSFGVAPIDPTSVSRAQANLGGQIGRLGKSLQAFQQRVATTEAEEALVNFEREKNQILFDPKGGYFNKQGKSAYDDSPIVTQTIADLQRSTTDKLSTSAQGMFSRASQAIVDRDSVNINRFASREFDSWETSVLQSRVQNSLENAKLYSSDDDQGRVGRAEALDIGRQSILDLAHKQGLPADLVTQEIQDFNSSFGLATIATELERSGRDGQIALANNVELLQTPDIVKMQENIDKKFKAEKVQADANASVNFATAIVEQYGDESNARELILQDANRIQDPMLRGKALRESMYQLGLKQAADSERRAFTFNSAEEFMFEGGSLQLYIANNSDAWDDLSTKQQKELARPGPVVTDFKVLSELMLLSDEEKSKINPYDYVDKLSIADRNRLVTQVQAAKKGGPESQLGRSISQQTTSTVNKIFGEPSGRSKVADDKVDSFYAMVSAEALFREQQKGSSLSTEEFTGLLNDMSKKVTLEKQYWFDTEMTINDISAEDMTTLSQHLHSKGIPVTSYSLIDAYLQATQ